MPTKITPATKQLALQKLRDGLTAKEVADLTGVSVRTLQDWKRKQSGKSGIPGGKPAQTQAAAASSTDAQKAQEQTQDDKTTLEFEDSPAPPEKKGAVDSAVAWVKGQFGIADTGEKAKVPPLSGKLSERQQRFVDSVSPIAAIGLITFVTWVWGRLGPEYSQLAPDNNVAQQILEPLLRIYARHSTFVETINPDVADVGASVFAIIGYVNVSMNLYQQIKREKEDYEQNSQNGSAYQRGYRPNPEPENGPGNASRGYADVRGSNGANGSTGGGHDGHPGSVSVPNLSDKEAAQHAALSRLAELDYLHRARRSGRA